MSVIQSKKHVTADHAALPTARAPKQSWSSFSPDILRQTLSYLEPNQVGLCERVNKTWKGSINETVWKTQCELQGVTNKNREVRSALEGYRSTRVHGRFNQRIFNILADYTGISHNYKNEFVNPYPSIAFGPDEWQRHFGVNARVFLNPYPLLAFSTEEWTRHFDMRSGNVPPLSANIHAILRLPCPFWKGNTIGETHLLTFILEGLSLVKLDEIVRQPKRGFQGCIKELVADTEDARLHKAHWALVTRDRIPQSRGDYWEQIWNESDFTKNYGTLYSYPKAIDVATCILTHHVVTGERLFLWSPESPDTFTLCQESCPVRGYPDVEPSQLAVGGFSDNGLTIVNCFFDVEDLSAAASRKL